MIDLLDLFGRGEIKRLSYELRDRENKLKAAEHEISYLRGVRTAQAAAVETLQERVRAEEELSRTLQAENRKLWDMYRKSEEVRQRAVERQGSESEPSCKSAPSSVCCADSFPPGGSLSAR